MKQKIKDWLGDNVWPFTVYKQRNYFHQAWLDTDQAYTKKTMKNAELIRDIGNLSRQLAECAVEVKRHATDGRKPVVVAYAVDGVKIRNTRTPDGQDGLPDVQYIYSSPVIIRFDKSKWNLEIKTPEAIKAFNEDLYRFVSQKVSKDIMREIDPLLNGKKE